MIYGRDREIATLNKLRSKRSASLVVVKGRRRIGKSALIAEFGKSSKRFVQFQGLAPRPGMTNLAQLEAAAKQVRDQFQIPLPKYSDWAEFFSHLAKLLAKGKVVLLLDEISWMGSWDRDFAGTLKIAWDTQFKNNPGLILVLCGSVSSWIEENILKDTDFVGRVSLVIRLGEIGLQSCSQFWGEKENLVSPFEKLKYLAVAGGVPKYLEELNPNDSIDDNIRRLSFTVGGYLFEDFEKIFSDIFGRRATIYKKIVRQIVSKRLTPKEIGIKIWGSQNGDLTEYLYDLEESGFVSRDHIIAPDGTPSKLSFLRISDNYLRFYLKYIEPNAERIRKGLFHYKHLDNLVSWSSICGLQFENLILNRTAEIIERMDISSEQILFAGPHIQTPAARRKGCQIDMLISCRGNSFYVCEIKFQRKISKTVINEVQQKIKTLSLPRRSSVHPVLIYAGELDRAVIESEYFSRVVNVEEMMC